MWCHLLLISPMIGLGVFLILPWSVALLLYLVIVALSFFLYAKVRQTRSVRRPVTTGREGLLGHVAEIGPEGSLKMARDRWLIALLRNWRKGQRICIIGFSGLRVEVQPVDG